MDSSPALRVLKTVTRLILVAVLILLAVRIVLQMAGVWIPVEYRLPGFPSDPYGFTLEDRIFWSQVDINFLLGDNDISYFDRYNLPDGSPMHNDRELRHMQDVYDLIQIVWKVLGWGSLAALVCLMALWRYGSIQLVGVTLQGAVNWTLIVMVLLALGLLAGFSVFFVGFHRIFFEGETWIFPYSDTFIRLYPERFWRDTFALVVLITLAEIVALHLVGRLFRREGSQGEKANIAD